MNQGRFYLAASLLGVLASSGCERDIREPSPEVVKQSNPCAIALASAPGDESQNERIEELQSRVRASSRPLDYLEQLGWAFVAQARASYDPGFYRLADAAALCIDAHRPRSPESMLLRGHVLHQLHEFESAETLARELVAERGTSFDYGLLGDVLLERGNLNDAADAYQAMMDEKPSPQAYIRAAQVRWLTGDLEGAIEAMEVSVASGATRDLESVAWAHVRLASYKLQAGEPSAAERHLEAAMGLLSDYAPALLVRGRLELFRDDVERAVSTLSRALDRNPLPEYQWALIEALEKAGRHERALGLERELLSAGIIEDPRTVALYLATRGDSDGLALRLALDELAVRADVHTLDAVSWSLHRAGRSDEAREFMERALAEGTRDPRLFLHAGVIAAATGDVERATSLLSRAAAMEQMLLPSERSRLHREFTALTS